MLRKHQKLNMRSLFMADEKEFFAITTAVTLLSVSGNPERME
jgi:hypothetical protein